MGVTVTESDKVVFIAATNSCITISGDTPNLFGLLKFLRSHNSNKSNPLSTGNVHLFEELKPVASAKEIVSKKKEKNEVENAIYKLKNPELITYLKALKQPTKPSIEENVVALLAFIDDKEGFKKFLGLSTDVRTPILADVEQAKIEGILTHDDHSGTWKLKSTGKDIMKVMPGGDAVEGLVDFMHNDSHGAALKDYVMTELEAIELEKRRKASEEKVRS